MTGLRFEVLGFAGGAPACGACSCYLVQSATTTIVLDCGPGAAGVLQRRGLLGHVDAIVISHGHADHNLDLVPLAVARVIDLWGEDRITLLAPDHTDQMRRLEATLGEGNPHWAAAYDERAYAVTDTLTIGDLTITFAPTTHSIPCNAIRVSDGEHALVYGADGAPSDAVAQLAADADLLVLEATYADDEDGAREHGHSTVRQSVDLARRAHAKRLVLTHLIPGQAGPGAGYELASEGLTVALDSSRGSSSAATT